MSEETKKELEEKNTQYSKKDLKSPIHGAPLIPREDGLFYTEYDDVLYTVDGSGTITPLQSPIHGAPLIPREDGLFYTEYDDVLYRIDESGKITPLQSPIHGAPLIPREDGLFYTEHDDVLYTVDGSGKISVLESENEHLEYADDNIGNIEDVSSDIRIDEINEETNVTNAGIRSEMESGKDNVIKKQDDERV